jgi:hypothetical protein
MANLENGAVAILLYNSTQVLLVHSEATADPACEVPSMQPYQQVLAGTACPLHVAFKLSRLVHQIRNA